ncbi:MAG: flavodoxin [Eggerthellaceae bacterium]|jgi:flavodoxin I
MNKVAVVYWSGTGNTEAMADLVAEGARSAGADVDVIQAVDFDAVKLMDYDAVAFGCPAMGDEELEEMEFEPMYSEVEPLLGDMKVALFGSYDWNNGEWMDLWKQRAEDAGVSVVDTVIAKDYPGDDEAAACKQLGAAVAA